MAESGRARDVKLSRKRKTTTKYIIHDPTVKKKVVCQLGMVFKDVKEFGSAVTKYVVKKRVQLKKCVNEAKRVRCKDDCPCLLYTCFDKTTND